MHISGLPRYLINKVLLYPNHVTHNVSCIWVWEIQFGNPYPFGIKLYLFLYFSVAYFKVTIELHRISYQGLCLHFYKLDISSLVDFVSAVLA